MAKKMCERVKESQHVKNPEKYFSKVLKPSEYCQRCGRVANSSDYLCRPHGIKTHKK